MDSANPPNNMILARHILVARPSGALCAPNFAPGEIVLGPPLTRLDPTYMRSNF